MKNIHNGKNSSAVRMVAYLNKNGTFIIQMNKCTTYIYIYMCVFINNILHNVSTLTCFIAPASSSFYSVEVINIFKVSDSIK